MQNIDRGVAGVFKAGWLVVFAGVVAVPLRAGTLDTIGVTLLNTVANNVNGSGVRVAQSEADTPYGGDFEVNPVSAGLAAAKFAYYATNYNSATSFPNTIGAESYHADQVGQLFYGFGQGVATNVAHVDSVEAIRTLSVLLFGSTYRATVTFPNNNDPVINQSFVFSVASTSEQTALDSGFDNYAAQYGALFVTAAGNGGAVSPPATCYNGLGVGAYEGYSSTGPTPDNGRAKPDLVAPAGETSFAAPLVSGAAAALMQAGLRGDGGSDTASAANITTVKALLINGAIKPAGWANPSPSPLDPNYGAGVLNVFNSYKQLTGGKHAYSAAASVAAGAAHPPGAFSAAVGALSGWDYETITSSGSADAVNHYYFNVTNGVAGAEFTTTATLVWNRHQNKTAINNLELFLYNAATGGLVASSASTVDNIQHIWVPQLPAGQYDLQVWKAGGNNVVSLSESYALAFEFFAMPLSITVSGTNVTLAWPVYPAGFGVQSTTNLLTGGWSTNYPAPVVNAALGVNQLVVPVTNAATFFQLSRP